MKDKDMQVIDKIHIKILIQQKVEEAGSQKALAERWGVSVPYVNDLLHGRRNYSPKILALLGLERVIVRSDPPK